MSIINLPRPNQNMSSEEVTNLLLKYYKELRYILSSLDDDNINSLDASKIKNLNVDQLVTNTTVTNVLYSNYGTIADLIAKSVQTESILSGEKVIYYIKLENQYIKEIQAIRNDELPQVQYEDLNGNLMYWVDETMVTMGEEETDYPVMVYQYEEHVTRQICFEADPGGTSYQIPIDTWGAGDGVTDLSAKARIYKNSNGLTIEYNKSNTEDKRIIRLDDNGIKAIANDGSIVGFSDPVSIAANSSSVAVGTTGTSFSKSIELTQSSNVFLEFLCSGLASTDLTLTIEISVNSTVMWTGYQSVDSGKYQMIDLDFPFTAQPTGDITYSVDITTDTGTFTVAASGSMLQLRAAGNSGGVASVYPEAEISETWDLSGLVNDIINNWSDSVSIDTIAPTLNEASETWDLSGLVNDIINNWDETITTEVE